jgi:hypothetical protein
MIPLIQFFFDSTVQEVPDQLLLRPYTQTTLLLALGFIGLMFIGLSRMWNLNSVSTIFRVFFNSESIEQAQKENIRFTSISFIMLLANYVVSAGLICWLWLTYFHIEDRDRLWLIAFALPILLAAFEILGIDIRRAKTNIFRYPQFPRGIRIRRCFIACVCLCLDTESCVEFAYFLCP